MLNLGIVLIIYPDLTLVTSSVNLLFLAHLLKLQRIKEGSGQEGVAGRPKL